MILNMSASALQNLLINLVTSLVLGIALIAVGYGIAVIVKTVLERALEKIDIEERMEERGLENALFGFSLEGVITGLVKWIIFLWFLVSAVNIIETGFISATPQTKPVLTNFLIGLVQFLPSLLEGMLIIIVGLLAADYLATKVREGIQTYSKPIAAGVRALAIYFTVTIALSNPNYNINVQIITQIFEYFVLAIAIGIGGGLALSIGLGLKDTVRKVARKHERSLEKFLAGKKED